MQGLQVKVSWYLGVSASGISVEDESTVGTVDEAKEGGVAWKSR